MTGIVETLRTSLAGGVRAATVSWTSAVSAGLLSAVVLPVSGPPAGAETLADLLRDRGDGGDLVLPASATVVGGTLSNLRARILAADPDRPATIVGTGAEAEAALAIFDSDVSLEGVRFQAPNPDAISLYAENSRVTLSACRFSGAAGIAVRASNTQLTVEGCEFDGADVAIGIDGDGRLILRGGSVSEARSGVIANGSGLSVEIADTEFYANSGVSISFDGTGNARIRDVFLSGTPLAVNAVGMAGSLVLEGITADATDVAMGAGEALVVVSNAGGAVVMKDSLLLSPGAGFYMEGVDRPSALSLDNVAINARGQFGIALFGIPREDRSTGAGKAATDGSAPDVTLADLVVLGGDAGPAFYSDGVLTPEIRSSVLATTAAKWPAAVAKGAEHVYARESVFLSQASAAISGWHEIPGAPNVLIAVETPVTTEINALMDALREFADPADISSDFGQIVTRIATIRSAAAVLLPATAAVEEDESAAAGVTFVLTTESGPVTERFTLAPTKELARRAHARSNTFFGEYEFLAAGQKFGTPRYPRDEARVGAALARAWQGLEAAAGWYEENDRKKRDWATQLRMNAQAELSVALIEAFGGPDSSRRLLEVDATGASPYLHDGLLPFSAALLDARFGRIPNGAVHDAFRKARDSGDQARAVRLAAVLAEFGHVGAARFLSETYAGAAGSDMPVEGVIDALAQIEIETGEPLLSPLFPQVASWMKDRADRLRSGKVPDKRLPHGFRRIAIAAVEVAAASGKKPPFPVQLLADTRFYEDQPDILALLDDPAEAFARMARWNKIDNRNFQQIVSDPQWVICRYFSADLWGTGTEMARRLKDRHVVSALSKANLSDPLKIRLRKYKLGMLGADCLVMPQQADGFASGLPDERAEELVFLSRFYSSWAERPARLANVIKEWREGSGDPPDASYAELADEDELKRLLGVGDGQIPLFEQLLIDRAVLLTNADAIHLPYLNGRMRRGLMRRMTGGGAAAGLIDVIPEFRDGVLRVEIQPELYWTPGNQGLGAAISGLAGEIKAALRDRGRGAIAEVIAVRGGRPTRLSHAGQSADGGHVFEAPMANPWLDTTLHVAIALGGEKWTLNYPLYLSRAAQIARMRAAQR